MNTKKLILKVMTIVLVIAVLLPLVACAKQTAVAKPATTTPPKPQVFTWADVSPLLARSREATVDKNTQWLFRQLYQGLVNYAPGTSNLVPELAKSWEVSPDGLKWTFHLKEGVTFSDGSTLTAAVVKDSLEKGVAPDSKLRIRLGGITKIEAVDDLTLAVYTQQPNSALPHGLAEVGGMIQGVNSSAENPIGSGPYALKEWNRGEEVVLERREDYWGQKPNLQKLVYLKRDPMTAVIALLKGELDMAKVTPESRGELEKTPGFKVMTPNSSMSVGLRLNTRVPPYDNASVRQAMNFAVDKTVIVRDILLGAGYEPNGLAGKGVFATYQIEGGYYPYNPAKAEALMQEAGLKKEGGKWQYQGKPLVFRMYTPEGRYEKDRPVAEYVASELTKFGLTVQHQVVPWTIWAAENIKKAAAKETDAGMNGYSLVHPINSWAGDLGCNSASLTAFCDSEANRLIAEAQATFDEAKQIELYKQAQLRMIEGAPYLLLYCQNPVWGFNNRVTGIAFTPNEIPITTNVAFE